MEEMRGLVGFEVGTRVGESAGTVVGIVVSVGGNTIVETIVGTNVCVGSGATVETCFAPQEVRIRRIIIEAIFFIDGCILDVGATCQCNRAVIH
jgi:hypothetical protein